jgi:hypothetical protein
MIELLRKKLTELFDSLLDPVWRWILSRSWVSRLLILLVLLSGAIAATEWRRFLETGQWMIAVAQATLFGDLRIPLSTSEQTRMKASTGRLIGSLEVDAVRLSQQSVDSWAAAQTAVALSGTTRVQNKSLAELVRGMKEPGCACLKERKDGNLPPHIPASAWGLVALSRLGEVPSNNDLGFLLKTQSEQGGWWGVFPTKDEKSASTFATAWAILALHKHAGNRRLNENLRARLKSAVNRGRAWLIGSREEGRARWKDYPKYGHGKESLSLSGLAVHALNQTGSGDLTDINERWVQDLPVALPNAGACEQAFVYVPTDRGRQLDAFCQLVVPWLLIGTTDVYASSSVFDRGTIVHWMNKQLAESKLLESDTIIEDWKRAELAFSLRYVLGDY